MFTDFNFEISLKKQFKTMSNILNLYSNKNINNTDFFHFCIGEYKDYIKYANKFKKETSISLLPNIYQDFVWHTHMLFPIFYRYSQFIAGHFGSQFGSYLLLDHNDMINKSQLKQYGYYTDQFWYIIKKHPNDDRWTQYACSKIKEMNKCKLLINGFIRRNVGNILIPNSINALCFNYYFVSSFKEPIKIVRRKSYEELRECGC